jgi:hypothetical protein
MKSSEVADSYYQMKCQMKTIFIINLITRVVKIWRMLANIRFETFFTFSIPNKIIYVHTNKIKFYTMV